MKLFLDDERTPTQVTWIPSHNYYVGPWMIVRSYQEFCSYITEAGLPDFISFDHDLADEHYGALAMYEHDDGDMVKTFERFDNTGYTAAKWLVEYCIQNKLQIPPYVVHSMNPVGKENIEKYLENAIKHLLD